MGRPRANANSIATPQRILEAAEQAFADRGFDARLSDIAAMAGIRRPSLLYHFKSKELLYRTVIADAFRNLGTSLRLSRSTEQSFERRLEAVTRTFVDFVEDHPSVARLVVRELLAGDGLGAGILVSEVVPLLDEIEQWIAVDGADAIRPNVLVRSALLQIVSDVLLRCSAGAVRSALWGPTDTSRTWQLNRSLFLDRPKGAAQRAA